MNKPPKRGEIWLLDWSPSRGSEQADFRPVLIIQTDAANSNPSHNHPQSGGLEESP